MPSTPLSSVRGIKTGRSVLTDRVHEQLKGLILDQNFSPGSRLNIDKLCRELHVSSSPLREALASLTAERLVRFDPFIGYSVTEMPDGRYYKDLLNLRLLLECQAARTGATKAISLSVKMMERAVRAMEKAHSRFRKTEQANYQAYHDFHKWDEQFHLALVGSAGNQPLTEAYNGLHVHLHIARLLVISGGFDTVRPVQDHRKILAAFEACDPVAAEEAVRTHVCNIQVINNWFGTETVRPCFQATEQRKTGWLHSV